MLNMLWGLHPDPHTSYCNIVNKLNCTITWTSNIKIGHHTVLYHLSLPPRRSVSRPPPTEMAECHIVFVGLLFFFGGGQFISQYVCGGGGSLLHSVCVCGGSLLHKMYVWGTLLHSTCVGQFTSQYVCVLRRHFLHSMCVWGGGGLVGKALYSPGTKRYQSQSGWLLPCQESAASVDHLWQ